MEDMANKVMRELYRPKAFIHDIIHRPARELQWAIAQSKRFVLDASMSKFLAYLSTTPFKVHQERRHDVLDSIRCSARLPAERVWIEFDGVAFREGLFEQQEGLSPRDIFGKPLAGPADVIATPGVLLEQVNPEQVKMTYFAEIEMGGKMVLMSMPFVWHWRTDNVSLPRKYDFLGAMLAHGITGYLATEMGVEHLKSIPKDQGIGLDFTKAEANDGLDLAHFREKFGDQIVTHRLVAELGGILRYVMAFLATLNDIPSLRTEVRTSKGFMARGRYRKYMDHTVMTLQLPRKTTMIKLAQRLVALTRKRWHTVNPHWRINKKPKGFLCEPSYKHIWSARDDSGHSYCSVCEARRVWIVLPNGRGDPTLGVVHHQEVQVTHAV